MLDPVSDPVVDTVSDLLLDTVSDLVLDPVSDPILHPVSNRPTWSCFLWAPIEIGVHKIMN